ncbi:hypothetical protein G4B88_009591 [Cannabis sativa]|uniref:RNase H type-1 domain-containing protein n=1 Tax=Cannabis sativa TaxID=3483 RepID=A0A7J6GEF1_CANSA|nr:hypothetical protein G4B88_009591 [Cannabis sativa]
MLSPEKSLPEGLLNKPVTTMEDLLSQTNNLTVLDEDGWEINEDGDAEVGKMITNSIHLRKAQEQGSIKQSDMLIPSEKSVAHNTQESGTEDMEVIVEMGPSMIDKTVGQKPDLFKGNPQLSGGINLINHKRNGDWREDLMGNLPSNLEILNSIDTQVSTTIQKTNTLETVQLFEVPVTYESKLNISGLDEGKSKRRKITPKRLKNSGSSNTGLVSSVAGKKEDGRDWKTEEIAGWFHEDDIPCVLGITPSINREDGIGWSLTTNGQYTVASGYKLRFKDPNIAECSDNSAIKAWWKVVWGSRLTPKMKIFIWHIDDSIWIPWAMEMLEMHLAAAPKDSHQKPTQDKVCWSPPPLGSFMINTDASLIEGKPGCGLGVIIRDHLGELVTAATDYIPGYLSVLMAETLAIRLALKLAASRSLQNIFIASDNQSVITALKGQTRFNTDWGKILEDCIIAAKNFNTLSFNFTPRKCNNVAHCFANWSRVAHISDVWTSFLPDCAAATLIADMPQGVGL